MALALLDLEQSVLNLLNEAFNSTLGDLPTGTGGAATIATLTPSSSNAASTIKTLLNEGAAELARTCYPVPDTGTLSWTSGTRSNTIASFAPGTTGNVFWTVRGVKYGSSTTGLRYCLRSALERNDPDWTVTANATPAYWYMDGEASIGIYPKPSSTGTVTIDGYVVPAPLSAASDTLPWIPDDLTHLLVWYAAAKLALKNLEDTSLAPRGPQWQALYDRGRQQLWEKIDPWIRKQHFPTPPAGGEK